MIKPIGGLCAQKQKNIDGKEDRLFLRQICRKIRWYVGCIFDPVILSKAKDPVGKIPLEFTFVSVLRRYLRLFLGNQCLSQRSLHSPSRGAILILVACFLPVILVGIKYSEKLFHSKDQDLKELKEISVDGTATSMAKRCAREAALAVARNWNPGLTLAQQQDAIYKVADAVYNASPIHQSSIIGQAIPGVDSSSVPDKQVSYNTDNAKYIRGWYVTVLKDGALWNVPYGMWRGIDLATAAEKRLSKFDELDVGELSNNKFVLVHQDIFQQPHPRYLMMSSSDYPSDKYYNNNSRVMYFSPGTTDSGPCSEYEITDSARDAYGVNQNTTELDGKYSTRIQPDSEVVKVEVLNDKIKATTDDQIWYAVPAQCNVDIVLAVPTNGAASNENNRDAASDTAEGPCSHDIENYIPDKAKKTPLYQMGQALKGFVKKHFYHTRGVNMALIPYSGKISIPPDRATSWTVAFPSFVDTSTNTQLMIGACLYGTSGVKEAELKQAMKTTALVTGDALPTIDTPYYWGGILTGCPIMFRAGYQQTETKYGGNSYFRGFLANYSQSGTALSATDTDPSKGASYKYLRMNLNPCYVGYANMLTMKSDKKSTHFLPNPYYMIEPTADLVKIYEMCNALYPIYDEHNISNFIFAPLEWAYNMFQDWTRNTNCSTKSGSGRSTSGVDDGATLSRPSKTASGRKKAVILLVNKPDWFEPGEMTYLGFNNDKSEVPTVLSDKIDFSINYTDTSKKYLDGSSYNTNHTSGDYNGINNTAFLAAGPNKILKCTVSSGTVSRDSNANNYYTSPDTSKIRLSFPHKGLLQMKVAPAPGPEIKLPSSDSWESVCYGGGKFVAISSSTKSAYSTDGITWSAATMPSSANWRIVCYGGGKFVAVVEGGSNKAAYSTDGITWSAATMPSSANWRIVCYGGGKFVAAAGGSSNQAAYSTDGITWSAATLPSSAGWSRGCYGGGKFVAIAGALSDKAAYSTDGITWSAATMPCSGDWRASCYGVDKFVAINWNTPKAAYSTTGTSWSTATLPSSASWTDVCYGDGKFVAVAENCNKAAYSTTGTGTWSATTLPASKGWFSVCYGDGKFVAVATDYNKAAYSTDGINWTDRGPAIGSVQFTAGVSNDTTAHSINDEMIFTVEPSQMNAGSEGAYYVDVQLNNVKLISAEITNRAYTATQVVKPIEVTYNDIEAMTTSKTEAVYDMIDFASSTAAKNGKLSSTFSGTVTGGLYTVASASGARITTAVRGAIELTIAPKMNVASGTITNGSITTKYGSNTSARTVSEKMTITIPPSDMQKSGTSYYMDFDATNVILLNAKLVKWEPECFTKPTVPSWSSVIDYSKKTSDGKLSYNTNLLFSQQLNGVYDEGLGYWRLTGGSYCIVDMQKYAKNDFYFFTEEYNPTGASALKDIWYGDGTQKSYVKQFLMYLPGVVGMFFKGTEYWPGFGHGATGNHKMIYGGFTQPINAALYNYVNGTTNANLDSYVSPSTDFNRMILKALTTAACAKLKADYGSDLRVYVVKYRKQAKYNSISSLSVSTWPDLQNNDTWTNTATEHSYTEIDNCASTTGGTAYDVTTEADLKAKLNAIAADIKDWAEYEEAKNIAPE